MLTACASLCKSMHLKFDGNMSNWMYPQQKNPHIHMIINKIKHLLVTKLNIGYI